MRKKSKYLSNLAVWTPTSQQKVCSDGSEKFLPQRKPSRKKNLCMMVCILEKCYDSYDPGNKRMAGINFSYCSTDE